MGSGRKNRRRADATQRAEEVRGAVKRHGGAVLRTLLALTLTLVFAVGGKFVYRWALVAPQFALEHVAFEGLHRASEAELLKLSGLAVGQNLLSLDVALVSRAMANHPWVRRVELSRHFPRGLAVQVAEREPAATVALGDLYLVDRDGEPFKRVQSAEAVDLVLITGIDRDDFVARREEVMEQMRSALTVADAYRHSPAAKNAPLSEVRIAQGGLSLVTGKDGQEVLLGEGSLEEKLARLAEVRAALAARSMVAEVIHLENRARPNWVAVRVSSAVSERNRGR